MLELEALNSELSQRLYRLRSESGSRSPSTSLVVSSKKSREKLDWSVGWSGALSGERETQLLADRESVSEQSSNPLSLWGETSATRLSTVSSQARSWSDILNMESTERQSLREPGQVIQSAVSVILSGSRESAPGTDWYKVNSQR